MSVNYQTDSYLLYNESICDNQLKHQELLVATLKQLAEENKRLLKEREQFENERSERKFEISILKQNFINLLTVGQYEFNKSKYMKHEFVDENKFHEIITKGSEINHQNMKNMNFLQELKLKFLHQLLKNNFKDIDNFNNYDNAFDCRPYKGPKTPPTPSSKYRNNSYFSRIDQNINSYGTKSTSFWSMSDMIQYLKKYKDIFQIYKKSAEHINLSTTNNIAQFQTNYNIYEPVAFDRFKNINEKSETNDMEFYQDLIEKHKKSLEMIENVGNKIHPIIDLSSVRDTQLNMVPKDFVYNNPLYELLNINNVKNHICNNFTSESSMKNPPILTDKKYSKSNDGMSINFNENITIKSFSKFPVDDTLIDRHNVIRVVDKSENTNHFIQKLMKFPENELQKLDSENEKINSTNKSDGKDSQNNFEDGEIIDSCDESPDKKPIIITKQTSISERKKKSNSQYINKTSNTLKSLIPSKFKRSFQHYSKSLQNTSSSFYIRYPKSKIKDYKSLIKMETHINEKNDLKHEEHHPSYYAIVDRRSSRYSKSNLISRKDTSNDQHSYRFFSNNRRYSPQY